MSFLLHVWLYHSTGTSTVSRGRTGQKIQKKSVGFNRGEMVMTALTGFGQILHASPCCQKRCWVLFTWSSLHVLLHGHKFSHNLFIKRKRKKKTPTKQPPPPNLKSTLDIFFLPMAKKQTSFSTSYKINKTVNSLSKQCVQLDGLEAFQLFLFSDLFLLISLKLLQLFCLVLL